MKHVVVVLIIAIAVFAVGCQQDTATAPVSNSSIHPLLKNVPVNQIVDIKADVTPGSTEGIGNGTAFHVLGQAFVAYTIIENDGDQIINFSINSEATITPYSPILPSGAISNHSDYQIALASKVGVILIQRDYYVETIGTKLHIVFAVAEDNTFSVASISMDPLTVSEGTAKSN